MKLADAAPLVRRTALAAALAVTTSLSACSRSDQHKAADVGQEVLGAKEADASSPPPGTGDKAPFEATAYSIEGETASGEQAREGICAADPDILPLGSRIRVHDAGKYSGECLVSDTGRSIKGREIDIYLASDAEAKRFGRKQVQVEVLSSAQ